MLVNDILQVYQDGLIGNYLGFLPIIGRNKTEIFDFVVEKVWRKLRGWRNKFLSRAGKELLIRTVAQSIPTYVMSVFLLHVGVCRSTETKLN